jgi:hypothetical protein
MAEEVKTIANELESTGSVDDDTMTFVNKSK